MKTPFPGMDPYLEHPTLWPDVHNSLIAAIRDEMSPLVAPRYYVALERRAYLLKPDDIAFIGRPDLSVAPRPRFLSEPLAAYGTAVLEVDLSVADEVEESFLEIRDVRTAALITLMELLSPVNKLNPDGRRQYEEKRSQVLRTRTNLVEIDLLRAGQPMIGAGEHGEYDYRVLVSRGWQRPRGQLYAFDLRQPIPTIPVPLQQGEDEPLLELNRVVHDLYQRARFDLRLDYSLPPEPPLAGEDAVWAQRLTQ